MARFSGKIAFSDQIETSPGVWVNQVTEKNYVGNVIQDSLFYTETDNLHDNLQLSNKFSVIVDPYALEHLGQILYVEWKGVKWSVSRIEIKHPRVIITVKEVYNG